MPLLAPRATPPPIPCILVITCVLRAQLKTVSLVLQPAVPRARFAILATSSILHLLVLHAVLIVTPVPVPIYAPIAQPDTSSCKIRPRLQTTLVRLAIPGARLVMVTARERAQLAQLVILLQTEPVPKKPLLLLRPLMTVKPPPQTQPPPLRQDQAD